MKLGDRMKGYEKISSPLFLPNVPLLVRLDGKNFSRYTSSLGKPFDKRLSLLMIDLTKHLVAESSACIGYTQSDEITLIFYTEDLKSQLYFEGKPYKLCSILASSASVFFNSNVNDRIPEVKDKIALFDARVFVVPNQWEAVNNLIWREEDATRNSISMAARSVFSHKLLHKKNCSDMQDMLMTIKGINWNNYPAYFKRGTYVASRRIERKFTSEELSKLPEKHNARKDPNLVVSRKEIVTINPPPLRKISNVIDFVFYGKEAVLR